LKEVPRSLGDTLRAGDAFAGDAFSAKFELPVDDGVLYLSRTHPIVEGLATYLIDTAIDPQSRGVACRAAVVRTRAVDRRTTLLLVRFRYDLVTSRADEKRSQLAEECRLLAFAGAPEEAHWLEGSATEALLQAEPHANIAPEQAAGFIRKVVEGIDHLLPLIQEEARKRAGTLLEAHRRVRVGARTPGLAYAVEAHPSPDVLGIYVYLPAT